MVKSQSERYLESLAPDRCAEDKPFEFERVKLLGVNLDTVAQFERKMREYSEDALAAEMEAMCAEARKAARQQQEMIDAAILRTACAKYAAITGKHAVDLTNGVPEDFRVIYDSVVEAVSVEMWMQPSEDMWRLTARFSVNDWGTRI